MPRDSSQTRKLRVAKYSLPILTGVTTCQVDWVLEQIDLPSHDNLLIRFRLDSDCDGFVADGWYVDDGRQKEDIGELKAIAGDDPLVAGEESAETGPDQGGWHARI